MKKQLLFISLFFLSLLAFGQDTAKARISDTLKVKRDTVNVPVLIIQKSQTYQVEIEYGNHGKRRYTTGYIVRTGYYSDAFEGKWREYKDVLYDQKHRLFSPEKVFSITLIKK